MATQPVKDIAGINQCIFEFKARGKHRKYKNIILYMLLGFSKKPVFMIPNNFVKVDLGYTENHAECTYW